MTRDRIIDALREGLFRQSAVLAMWLEGSGANSHVDEYSDIDLVVDVEDGAEDGILAEAERILSKLGSLDRADGPTRPNPYLWHKLFHLTCSSEFLIIDFVVQRHSRNFVFQRGKFAEEPRVLFDKADVVRFAEPDNAQLQQELTVRLEELWQKFSLQTGVKKYLKRGKFLEALAYYHKYVLEPLVELLRIRYAPLTRDYHLVRVSDHLPVSVVAQLEDLYKVSTTDEIAAKLKRAGQLFQESLEESRRLYQ
jgi:predicted nucleotidyltransferase